jgi:hypothetical protein
MPAEFQARPPAAAPIATIDIPSGERARLKK